MSFLPIKNISWWQMTEFTFNKYIRTPSYEEKIKELLKDKVADTRNNLEIDDFITKWGTFSNKQYRVVLDD